MGLAKRLKEARSALKLTQAEAAIKFGFPIGSLRKYESGPSEPGSAALAGIVLAGINANWLLTGEGPMLLKDLQEVPAPAPRINIDALVQAFCVSVATAPKGETMEQSARKAVQFYLYCLDQGLITPEGLGTGIDGKAA